MRGQAAFEYLMIFSIVMVLVLIMVAYASQTTERNQEELRLSNAISAANDIVDAANIVNTQGSPSQITLTSVYIPEGIDSINITGNMIIIKVRVASGITDVFVTSKATLDGSISNVQGVKRIRIKAEEYNVTIAEV